MQWGNAILHWRKRYGKIVPSKKNIRSPMTEWKRKVLFVISYIRGSLTEVEGEIIVVEASSVGYNIHVPVSLLEVLPPIGSEVKIYTYLRVSEDAMTLYGFGSRQELSMFKELLGVNGVGPKGALGVLSALGIANLRVAVAAGDARAIAKAPGIGLKTAQKVILELKDRISMEDALYGLSEPQGGMGQKADTEGLLDGAKEAVEALTALGYSASEAAKAVRRVERAESMTPEAVLKAALKYLAF